MARLSGSLGEAGCLLFCCWFGGCLALWRYRTNTGDFLIFSTRTTIHLEYEGTTFQQWDTGSFCTITDVRSPRTTMYCSVPGTHRIFPIVTNPTFEDNERHLSVLSDVNCFMWYVYQQLSDVQGAFIENQAITAWIFDPENAYPSEVQGTARSPPLYSKTLSKQFANLGQRPSIATLQYKTYSGKSRQEGSWVIVVPTVTNDVLAVVTGGDLTFQDCFVLDTPIVIAQLTGTTWPLPTDVSISLPAGTSTRVEWSACVPTAAVLATDFGVFRTTDGFLTYNEVKIPDYLVQAASRNMLTDLVVDDRAVVVLIDNWVLRILEFTAYSLQDLGIPHTGVIGLEGRMWCASSYPVENNQLSNILIWTEDEIYYGLPGEVYNLLANTDDIKEFLGLRSTVQLTVIAVCYDSLPSRIIMLLSCIGCMPTPMLHLASYDEETEVWELSNFFLPPPPPTQGNIHIEVLYGAKTSIVLWNDVEIYYSYQGNKFNGYFFLTGSNVTFSAAAVRSTIHQVVVDYGGNTIVKLTNNDIYFFKFGLTDIIRLPVWVNGTTSCIFYLNTAQDSYLLKIARNVISRETYPLRLEVFSVTHPLQEMCPYISFQHNVNQFSYYLDKGENITFWAQLVYQENLGLATDIEIHMPLLLKQKSFLEYEIARGICTKNWTVTLYHDHDYTNLHNYNEEISLSKGVLALEIRPSLNGKTCSAKHVLTHLRVGCYPEKYVLIEGSRTTICRKFNFTIRPQYLWVPPADGKPLHLEFNKEYGCPIPVHHESPFRPELGVYMDRKRIGTVQSNYVLWEINGRKDFSFNATMKQIGCNHVAQNWSSILFTVNNITFQEALALDDEEFMKLWGPHNYQSCFSAEHADERVLRFPYLILNSSGINFIKWPKHHTGIYLFRLRIVDPNFSFCDPYVKFSVRTYGVIRRPNIYKIIGWSILILALFLGALLFSYYRFMKLFRNVQYVDPLQSYRESPSPKESEESEDE